MSFVRPEARAAIARWREALAGAALAGLGLFWIIGPGGLLGWAGIVLLLAGGALIWIGVQRARFRGRGGGIGMVQVDERQITYFGPMSGGSVSLSELTRLTLDPSGRPAHWMLAQPGEPPLAIPVNAEGADQLFDAFAALPGLRTEYMLQNLREGGAHPVVIWERQSERPAHLRLH